MTVSAEVVQVVVDHALVIGADRSSQMRRLKSNVKPKVITPIYVEKIGPALFSALDH